MKKLLIVSIILTHVILFAPTADANADTSEVKTDTMEIRYLFSGGGWKYLGIRDKGMSPLLYSGHNGAVNSGLLLYYRNISYMLDLSLSGGSLSPDISLPAMNPSLLNVNFHVDHTLYFRIENLFRQEIQFHAGIKWLTQGITYNHSNHGNNSFNYMASMSLGPAIKSYYTFWLWKREFRVGYEASTPLFTSFLRPSFINSIPSGFLEPYDDDLTAFRNSLKLSGPATWFSFHNVMHLQYILENKNALKLSYAWQISRLHDEHNPFIFFEHSVIFSTLFNF